MLGKFLSIILFVCIFLTTTNSCIEVSFETGIEATTISSPSETSGLAPALTSDVASPVDLTETMDLPFTGIWQGVDPYDGSIFTLNLVQSGEELQGTFGDTFTKSVKPPGFSGPGLGTTSSATSGEMRFQVSRWDGASHQLDVKLILSDQNNTMTLIFLKEGIPDPTEEPVRLQRQ